MTVEPPNHPTNPSTVMITTPLLSLVSGLIILGWSGMPIYRSLTSWFWPTTEGLVQTTQVSRNHSREAQTRRKPFYFTVQYQYTVNSADYVNDRHHFATFSDETIAQSGFVSYEAAQAALQQTFPSNQTVAIYYQPGNPELSVLQPGFHYKTSITLALITGLLAYGGYGLLQWSQQQ